MSDLDKLIKQATKGGKQAKKSAEVGSRKLTDEPAVETEAKEPLQHIVRVFGMVDDRKHGGKRPTQRIIDPVWQWLEDNVDGPHSVAINWLLAKGIEYAESQLETGDITITDGDLPTK